MLLFLEFKISVSVLSNRLWIRFLHGTLAFGQIVIKLFRSDNLVIIFWIHCIWDVLDDMAAENKPVEEPLPESEDHDEEEFEKELSYISSRIKSIQAEIQNLIERQVSH